MRGQGVDRLVQQDAVGQAEQRDRPLVAQTVRAGTCEQLVEDGQ